jgi:hypothetical protein
MNEFPARLWSLAMNHGNTENMLPWLLLLFVAPAASAQERHQSRPLTLGQALGHRNVSS